MTERGQLRDLAILEEAGVKPKKTVILKREDYVNQTNNNPDLLVSEEELPVGVLLGVLASDVNIEGIALQRIKTTDSLFFTFIVKNLTVDDQSRLTVQRCQQGLSLLRERFEISVNSNFFPSNGRRFPYVSRSIRRKSMDESSTLELLCFFRFR